MKKTNELTLNEANSKGIKLKSDQSESEQERIILLRMLTVIPHISENIASRIAHEFKSLHNLYEFFENNTESTVIHTIGSLKMNTGSGQKIGPKRSQRIYISMYKDSNDMRIS